ncbi:MAG: bifunctional precorrin-2 dehydrogenase/sirohydrochlorin ferrochelatase [Chloroflexota bacterium]
MIIDFKFKDKYVVMVGGGSEAFSKIKNFLDAGSDILVVSRNFSNAIIELSEKNKITLLKSEISNAENFLKQLNPKPYLLAVATSDHMLNASLADYAKQQGLMVYVADNPIISDFILPAVSKIGDVRITISTGGRSPAMAKTLRERIESLITPEDLLHIELQEYIRQILKQQVAEQKDRKRILYEILEDKRVAELLKQEKLDEAKQESIIIMEKLKVKKEQD